MQKTECRILAVDDHIMVLNGIRTILEGQGMICDIAQSAEEAEKLAAANVPALLLVDYAMPGKSGDLVVRAMKQKWPALKVLVYTLNMEEEVIMRMIYAGINGYLLKSACTAEFLKAVDTVLAGEEYFSCEVRNQVVSRVSFPGDEIVIKLGSLDFQQREIEIIRMIAMEMTAREIGQTLFLSEHTVEAYRSRIIQKLGVRNAVGVVKFALKNGIVRHNDL
jgi:DNA-binding NarL/FixJ family response regulator